MSVKKPGHDAPPYGHDSPRRARAEELKKITVSLEVDQIELLKTLSKEYSDSLGQRWSISALVRVAVGDLLTKMGKMS